MTSSSFYLVGNREIRQMLGDISRQRVYQLTSRPDFPAPIANLSQGKVWLGGDVEKWMDRKRRPRFPVPAEPAEPPVPSSITWVSAAPQPVLNMPPRPRPAVTNAGRPYDPAPCCPHLPQHADS
ncbi:helix-turn-helix transcriptional regulator [Actinoplanes couchii]|uniref:AlpA family phage regulatory protein n=1 Tax=Actinoplanes couchii TaxID=403638 RepID=A0ABQ3XH83_9ACTN|nr:putative DNA-binding transcriptional regulator AlpA [Actinoplanes couchii]GID57861.1 hypothetical protein Aco03nite_062650 [Actinoplanes couchii]